MIFIYTTSMGQIKTSVHYSPKKVRLPSVNQKKEKQSYNRLIYQPNLTALPSRCKVKEENRHITSNSFRG